MEKLNPKTGRWEKVPGKIPKDAREFTVPKLKEGEDYKFRVMAENENGTSEPLETERSTKAKNPFGRRIYDIKLKRRVAMYSRR